MRWKEPACSFLLVAATVRQRELSRSPSVIFLRKCHLPPSRMEARVYGNLREGNPSPTGLLIFIIHHSSRLWRIPYHLRWSIYNPFGIDDIHGRAVMIYRLWRMIYHLRWMILRDGEPLPYRIIDYSSFIIHHYSPSFDLPDGGKEYSSRHAQVRLPHSDTSRLSAASFRREPRNPPR